MVKSYTGEILTANALSMVLGKVSYTVIAVDEVLTGVCYICLGKWIEMGLVLAIAEMVNIDTGGQSGKSTGTNYNEAIFAFKQVIPHLNNITEHREKVFKLPNTDKSKA
eukprot:540782-Ditylum_brightwellii.AAC.1